VISPISATLTYSIDGETRTLTATLETFAWSGLHFKAVCRVGERLCFGYASAHTIKVLARARAQALNAALKRALALVESDEEHLAAGVELVGRHRHFPPCVVEASA